MNEQQITRRLAAILAADIAGYSRMIASDESGTVVAVQRMWADIFGPSVASRRGRVVKLMGDGALAEFGSAVDAVECALAVQYAMSARNSTERMPITLRIGINLGEIIIDGGDIFGDGVILASRLEVHAPNGGILVSDAVHAQVKGKIGVSFMDAGGITLKNIDHPIKAWRWTGSMDPVQVSVSRTAAALRDERPSIAVLPFDNLSGDPEQGYFADGITEDIITDLSKVSGLFVIARNSSFAYRDQASDLRKVGGELGVRHVLEGSVRRAAGKVRINAQLIDATTGGHVWAERYDRDLEDLLDVQDEVTRTIVKALRVKLTPDEEARRETHRKIDPEAYDLFVRASQNLLQFRPEALLEARTMLERAIELDPGMAVSYARLSIVHTVEYANQWNMPGPDHVIKALELARKAVKLDQIEPRSYEALAIALFQARQPDEAERAAERAVDLDPNYASGYVELGNARHFKGDHDKAIEAYRKAHKLDPQFDLALQFLGRALLALSRFDEAEAALKRRLALAPRSDMTRFYLASLYGRTGRHEEARRAWYELLQIKPDFSVGHFRQILPYNEPHAFEWFLDGIRQAGIVIED